jgi:hypothetical protein
MPPNPKSCPKCAKQMEDGFLLDGDQGGPFQGNWAEGKPAFGWFGGLKVFGRVQRPITAFRCTSCGYVELYAIDREEAGHPEGP